jgi:hypothetical protein
MSPSRSRRRQATAGAAGPAAWLDPNLILIVLFALFPIGPLLGPGYPWDAHDARHSVYFVFELDRGIQDGILYPRWQPDFAFGYGYPFFNIYGPLSSFAAEAFHLLGMGFADSVKAVFALSVVLSGLAMYGFAKQVMGRQAGLVAAVAYMVIPYRLVDLYVRAALAESVAYVFVPLVLWAVWSTLHRPRLANVLGLAVAYAALMVTTPLVTLLLTVILVFYIAFLALARVNDEQPWRGLSRESLWPLLGHLAHLLAPPAAGLVLGFGLSAFFALPATIENRFVRVDQWYGGRYAWGGDFVEFFQLFSPRWGFGASVPGPNDNASFQLGAVPVVLSLLALVPVALKPARDRLGRDLVRLLIFFAAVTAVVVFLMLGLSAPLWQALPLVRLAQFPWRLLTLTVVSMSFLCGAVACGSGPDRAGLGRDPAPKARSERGPGLPTAPTLALVALLILGSLPYMRAEMSDRPVNLAELMKFQQSADEMTGSTAWVQQIPRWSPIAEAYAGGDAQPLDSKIGFRYLHRQAGKIKARSLESRVYRELVEYTVEHPVLLTFNSFYYPGWHAYRVDPATGAAIEELSIALRGELGLITVRLPAGTGQVLLRFEDTPVRKLSQVITWLSLALIGVLVAGRLLVRAGRRTKGAVQ